MKITQGDQRGRIRREEPAPFQADKRDQQSDTDRNSPFQRIRNGMNESFADAPHRHEEEYNAGNENGAQSDLPRIVHRGDHCEREEKVVSHRRRDSNRIIRKERHQKTTDCAHNARRREQRLEVHSGGRKHRRLYENDVGHCHECRQTGKDLGADGGLGGGEMEPALEEFVHLIFSHKKAQESQKGIFL